MKKIIYAFLILLLFAATCHAAGTCTQSEATPLYSSEGFTRLSSLILTCTGDSSDGSVVATALNAVNTAFIAGKYLYSVCAYPTPGGTTPSVTGITVTNAQGRDVLGGLVSGRNTLVPTTLEKCTAPYNTTTELYEPYPVDGTLSITGGTGTASQQYTLKLTFFK